MSKPDLHKRLRDYLSQFKFDVDMDAGDETTWVRRGKLKTLALGQGYRIYEINSALKALTEDVDVAVVWHSKERTEFICLFPMTDKERQQAIDDIKWFDSLPG